MVAVRYLLDGCLVTFISFISYIKIHLHSFRHSFPFDSSLQETADLVTLTEEILNGKLHFMCSVNKCLEPDRGSCRFLNGKPRIYNENYNLLMYQAGEKYTTLFL